MARKTVGIHEKLPILESLPLSFQHLTAMFGATILVPILLGVNPAIALLMNGIGTLLYSWITKGGIPAYLGSSFAFIAPTLLIITSYGGFSHAQAGFIFFGLFFIVISFVVKKWGIKWIDVVMPPAVMGAVVAIIGLELAPVAAQQSGLAPWPANVGSMVEPFIPSTNVLIVSMFTLAIGIIGSVMFRGFLQVIPILIAVVAGYMLALAMGMVDTTTIGNASWFALPKFQAPVWDINAIIIIAPACIVVLAEHISHLIVTGKITESDLMKNPGLHRSLLGDGISNVISGFAGSPPNTTYGENIGVMAITRVYSVWIIRGAAILAIAFSCIGKVSAAISTIPTPVMGGITMLLYGVIAVQGFRMFVEQKVDFSKNRNMVLGAITFVVGVSGASISIGSVQLKGMAFAAIVGVVLSLLFWLFGKLGWMNNEV
ncbi:MAG: uracil permease [Bacteroidetes bacterium GWF2_42_66]|nr:MAG: uracil permease [Bacteroidetes bacterium GWA2_42_15]OFX99399.1 MAG: uracil permease [Bacteroidetes bacterium GWE2_42_39]OFY40451.1 MAG: uracil permease [Bacteroidetes bacterium GWF2_42_66]HBL76927.1 uracil permease [Prolixibacteraceae bacterium]HCR90435.1 uracil permease [Prolixibacteraceae bacterium]